MTTNPRVWLITGSSTGIGLEMTRRVLANGDIAVATLRKPAALASLAAQYGPDRLLVLSVDVTVPADILAAFQAAADAFGRIDVVVSNAGVSVLSEIEGTPDEPARAVFEVNFWGATHVLQEAVRFMREVNPPGVGGRIIQISSGISLGGYPACGFYCASKHAIEGLAESLAGELDPEWNIRLTIITLGAYRTSAVATGMTKLPVHPAYAKDTLPVAQSRQAILASLNPEKDPTFPMRGDPAKAADALYRLSSDPEPPVRVVLGMDVVGAARAKVERLSKEAELSVSWSEGLDLDE